MARIDEGVCERLINAATAHCNAVISPPPAPVVVHDASWDSVTTGLSDLSTAITYGMFVLAVLALLGVIGWGYFVRQWAKDEAIKEARKAAEEWFDKEAPAVLAELTRPLNPGGGNLPDTPAAQAAEDIAQAQE